MCLPEIDAKFKSLGYDSLFFSLNWFVCLYTERFCQNVSSSIIDMIFLMGSEVC